MQCHHETIKACWGFQLFNILDVFFYRGWPTDWMSQWILSWEWAAAADRKQSQEVVAVWTRQCHSLAKWTRPGIFCMSTPVQTERVELYSRHSYGKTADDKMEEQTDVTNGGINWQHLRCVLKQIHRMRLCTFTFSCYQLTKLGAESRRRLSLKWAPSFSS